MTYKHKWMGWVLCAALACGGLTACDDSNSNASPTEISSAGRKSSSSAVSGAGKGGSKSESSSSAGEGGSKSESSGGKGGSSAGKGGSGGKGGSTSASAGKGGSESSAPQDCKDQGPADCICEAPKNDEQFLNHCSAATCSPFDNKKLTKLKSDGTLPALP